MQGEINLRDGLLLVDSSQSVVNLLILEAIIVLVAGHTGQYREVVDGDETERSKVYVWRRRSTAKRVSGHEMACQKSPGVVEPSDVGRGG